MDATRIFYSLALHIASYLVQREPGCANTGINYIEHNNIAIVHYVLSAYKVKM